MTVVANGDMDAAEPDRTGMSNRSGIPEAGDADDGLTVGRTAELVGVSVRTLHHWDAIGLVRPSARTRADYRVHRRADVERIQQVLLHRELGLSLAEVRAVLDDPDAGSRRRWTRSWPHSPPR